MMRARPAGADRRPRPSRAVLVFAVVTSAAAVVLGQWLMWALYSRTDVALAPAAAHAGDPLVVAVARTPGGPGEWVTYAKVFSELQRNLRRPVRIRYLYERAEVVDLLRDGKADIALLPTYRYLQLAGSGDAVLLATPVLDGLAQDAAVIVTAAGTGANDFDDLRGKDILLSDPRSLGGYAFVYWLLDQRASRPEEFFSRVAIGGAQDKNLGKVASGEASAACVNRSALATWPSETFRIVAQSPEYGMPPIVARSTLDRVTRTAIQDVLTTMAPGEGIPEDSSVDGFAVPRPADYDFARVLARRSSKTSQGADWAEPTR